LMVVVGVEQGVVVTLGGDEQLDRRTVGPVLGDFDDSLGPKAV
jgi:hypothetical protein